MSLYSGHLSDAYRFDEYVNDKLKVNNDLFKNKNHVVYPLVEKRGRGRFEFWKISATKL